MITCINSIFDVLKFLFIKVAECRLLSIEKIGLFMFFPILNPVGKEYDFSLK